MTNTELKFIVTFAGCVGSSKTPIANKLSGSFGLPVFNSDAIRTEVAEDLGKFDQNEYRDDVNLSVTDAMFSDRLDLSEKALSNWINKLKER